VDDCLFFAPHQEDIDATLERLRGADLDFNVESNVCGFLGVLLTELDDGKIELTQTGLTDRIITSMGLEDANPKESPAEYGALPTDREGDPCNEGFNYPSVVGMLIYLASNSRPDIAFAVHQCARFTHHSRLIHEQALKRIGRCLVGTKTKGLILDPKRNDLGIDLFVDADFAGLWSYEDPQDPSCVKSQTGDLRKKCLVGWLALPLLICIYTLSSSVFIPRAPSADGLLCLSFFKNYDIILVLQK
jgi:hypothetical protein